MKIIKDIRPWLVALFPGWWKWGWIGLGILDVIGRYASSFNPWVEQNRWVTDWVLLTAFFIAGFRLYRRQQEENQKLRGKLEELNQPEINPDTLASVKDRWSNLTPLQKRAVQLVLTDGILSWKEIPLRLRKEGGVGDEWNMKIVFNPIVNSGLIQPVPGIPDSWVIKPALKKALEQVVSEEVKFNKGLGRLPRPKRTL